MVRETIGEAHAAKLMRKEQGHVNDGGSGQITQLKLECKQ